ncbi:MAG: hypothetical protein AAFR39_00320 [Pseudomonadota bacterium]
MRHWMKALASIGVLFVFAARAAAGPEGIYDVRGTEIDGTAYSGLVKVVRTGETYSVNWLIGEYRYYGSGIGASPLEEGSIVGPAHDKVNVLTVGYTDGDEEVGTAFYMEQENGVWQGIWTEYGSEQVSTENWYPLEAKGSKDTLEY